MENYNFNEYGFVESTQFDGLMPKLMKQLGDDFTIGEVDEPVVSIYDPTANGVQSMKVIDIQKITEVKD